MDLQVISYLAYLAISIPLTVWVGRTLSRHGQVFLEDVISGNERVAHATNQLLVVGFYLLNFGFVMWFLRVSDPVVDVAGIFDTLSLKVGVVLLVLGAIHLLNLMILSSMRGTRQRMQMNQARLAPMPGPAGPGYPPVPR